MKTIRLIAIGLLIIIGAVSGAVLADHMLFRHLIATEIVRDVLKGALVTGVVLTSLQVVYRKHVPQAGDWSNIPTRALTACGAGAATLAIVAGALYTLFALLGSATMTDVHVTGAVVGAIATTILVALLFEALPEEFVIRGLLFGALRERMRLRWALIVQALLFVIVGVSVRIVLEAAGIAANAMHIVDYIILLLLFGIALGCVRIFYKSIWASIGFHLVWLLGNRHFFDGDERLVTIAYNPSDMQPILLLSILIVSIVVMALGIRRRQRTPQTTQAV